MPGRFAAFESKPLDQEFENMKKEFSVLTTSYEFMILILFILVYVNYILQEFTKNINLKY